MDWTLYILIGILFAWCFSLSYYLWRTQMRTGRLLLRIARLEELARNTQEAGR